MEWKTSLTQDIVNERSLPLKEGTRMIRFLIDIHARKVRALKNEEKHIEVAAQTLGVREDELSTQNAGHLVGGIIVYTEKGEYLGHIMMTTLNNRPVHYTRDILEKAKVILYDYLYRSTVPKTFDADIKYAA